MRRAAWLSLVVLACRPQPAGVAGPQGSAEKTERADAELAAVAAEIDPGEQAPLLTQMPTWLKSKVQARAPEAPASPAAIAAAREALLAWEKRPGDDPAQLLAAALELGRGVLLAEQALAAGGADPELLAALTQAYALVGQLGQLEQQPLFATVLGLAGELARKEGVGEARQLDEARAYLRLASERAPALQMHTAATLLRRYPEHPTALDVLAQAAEARLRGEEFAAAKRLRALAVARKGARATAGDQLALANTCYRALDVACGDAAVRAAAEREDPGDATSPRRLAEARATGERARRVLALGTPGDLVAGLERGQLLLELARVGDAEAQFSSLRAAHPGDARPVTGLAMVALQRSNDFVAAAALVRSARELAGRDRRYLEVALGSVALASMQELAVELGRGDKMKLKERGLAAVAELAGLVDEFARHDPARAAVIALALAEGQRLALAYLDGDVAAATARIHGLPREAAALTKKFPDSPDAWKLNYALSRWARGPDEALAMIDAPLPAALASDADVQLQRARALLDLMIHWERGELAPAVDRALTNLPAGAPADEALHLRVTLDALAGRHGDAALLQRAIAGCRELVARTSGVDRAMHANNLAVLLATAGDAQGMVAAFTAGSEAAPGEPTLALNAAAVTLLAQGPHVAGLPEQFAAAVERGETATLRLQGRAWLVALADAGRGDVAVARAEFIAAVASERASEARGDLSFGRAGVAIRGDYKISFGFTTTTGLALVDEVRPRYWQILTAPTTEALIAAAAPPARRKSKAKPR